ncbi:hypothetical protein GCM10007425_18550 [Lysinibacillus alkalisoli]|uniref:DUF418 domain-containing protein n=1 Tax=Lysinibacillus alkalisoli TaxID=1911548 RepID=A0A917G6I4_9BACI|nr:DUF418 domain-containing protein [Lysinibacillus alkalisoli]GGG24337.1 hypothetical protein GCM10007425_18550 [Lysinibacillus alkalisoli]
MDRFTTLDIARGVAILGTLGTNIWIFTMSMDNTWISQAFTILTNGKFLGLLTLMFGIGMQLKYNSLQKRGLPWYRIYWWSMLILFVDGLLHFIFVFEFDVLMSYSLVGILASIIITRSKKCIIIVLLLALSIHVYGQLGGSTFFSSDDAIYDELHNEREFTEEELLRFRDDTFMTDTTPYWAQVQLRLEYFWENRSEAIMILPMNLALFLLGALLVQSGLIGNDQKARRIQRRLLFVGLFIGIPLLIASQFIDELARLDRYVIAPFVSIFYLGVIFIWSRTSFAKHLQKGLSNVGKMALTCYIGQNIIASILFYSWGIGLAPLAHDYLTAIAWLSISTFLIIGSSIWLRFFKRGPIESLWKKIEFLVYPKA